MSADTVHSSISRALAGLATERAQLDEAIATLERSVRELASIQRRLARDKVPGGAVPRAARPARKRANWSPAARRAAARRMRQLWAARRKAAAGARKAAKKP